VFLSVSEALTERRVLRFDYRKPGQEAAEKREIRPYHMTWFEDRWYLLGHDELRQGVRMFALSGTDVTAESDEAELRSARGFRSDKGIGPVPRCAGWRRDYQVVLELDRWLTDVLRGGVFTRSRSGLNCRMGARDWCCG